MRYIDKADIPAARKPVTETRQHANKAVADFLESGSEAAEIDGHLTTKSLSSARSVLQDAIHANQDARGAVSVIQRRNRLYLVRR